YHWCCYGFEFVGKAFVAVAARDLPPRVTRQDRSYKSRARHMDSFKQQQGIPGNISIHYKPCVSPARHSGYRQPRDAHLRHLVRPVRYSGHQLLQIILRRPA
ncbi:hypothetical protein VaNZ11_011780, partial [Volvox africanus]